jgi:aspartyl-tRNA(Asn)/glutamyl-tRNA(Gln) amidotransferase subunit B
MPDPDIPPTVLDDEQLTHRPDDFPLMPDEWRKILRDLGLDPHHIESLIDSEVEFEELSFLPLIQDNLQNQELAKHIANWTVNITVPLLREQQLKLENSAHIKLEKAVYELLKENKLSSTNAKKLLTDLLMADKLPTSIEEYAKTQGLIQVSNVDEIAVIVDEVIRQNTVAVEDVRRGEAKAIGFLVGQVMKQSKGKANPSIVQQLIRKRLS